MPVKTSEADGSEVSIKNLTDYKDSLDALLKKYSSEHKDSTK